MARALEAAESSHNRVVKQLQQQHAQQLSSLEASLTQQHLQELTQKESEWSAKLQAEKAALVQQHDEEAGQLRRDQDAALAELQSKLAALQAQMTQQVGTLPGAMDPSHSVTCSFCYVVANCRVWVPATSTNLKGLI